ncbi:MAG: hypothetical protein LBK06_04500 [Planctomycetaceae bacterium]|nr:hypothetical protein [Planctomycetaceae bacterium]
MKRLLGGEAYCLTGYGILYESHFKSHGTEYVIATSRNDLSRIKSIALPASVSVLVMSLKSLLSLLSP